MSASQNCFPDGSSYLPITDAPCCRSWSTKNSAAPPCHAGSPCRDTEALCQFPQELPVCQARTYLRQIFRLRSCCLYVFPDIGTVLLRFAPWPQTISVHHDFFHTDCRAAFQRILRAFPFMDQKNPLKPFGFKGFLAQRVGFEPTCGCPQTDSERNKRDTQAAYVLIIGFKNAENRQKQKLFSSVYLKIFFDMQSVRIAWAPFGHQNIPAPIHPKQTFSGLVPLHFILFMLSFVVRSAFL